MLSLKKILFEIRYTTVETEKIADVVEACYNQQGIDGVTDYDTLQSYLDKLPFYVPQNKIKIGPWRQPGITNEIQNADIYLDGTVIGTLTNINKTTAKGSGY